MLNALKIMDVLSGSGLTEKQVRAIADTHKIAIEESGLAGKEDLEKAVMRLESEIKGIAARINLMFAVLVALVAPILVSIFAG